MIRRTCMILGLIAFVAPAQAAEKFVSMLSDDAKTLSYSPCSEEDSAECISHDLHCRGDDGFGDGLAMTVLGGASKAASDVRKLGKALIDKPLGEANVRFTVGGKTIDLPANAVTVSLDEMNGNWDLSLHFMEDGEFFDALSKKSAESVTADVAGAVLKLSSGPADAANMLKFKTACAN